MRFMPTLPTGIPHRRLAVIGLALLAAPVLLAVGFTHHCHCTYRAPGPTQGYRLELVVEDEEPGYYGSQWNLGSPVVVDHDASDGAIVQFQRRWPFEDGCWWESTETLRPIGPDRYDYSYIDRAVSCVRGATQGIPTVRTGTVLVVTQ